MNPKVSGALIAAIVIATFATGAAVYPTIGAARLAFGAPLLLLVLGGLWALLPAIDPIAKGFSGFRHVYDFFWILLSAVIAYAYAVELGRALGERIDALRAVVPAVAALVVIAGALLPLIRRNWFFGIRTPWTLTSDEDWARTHRFGRPVFMAAGAIILIGAFTDRAWSVGLIVGSLILAATSTVVYSYLAFTKGRTGRI